jgi:CBS domain containing-hemolysin-like protein
MLEIVIVILIILTGSAICAAAETALFSVSLIKVKQLAQTKQPMALALLAIRKKMGRPIATIVILNNTFNIIGSIIIGSLAADILGDAWLGLFSGVLTFLIIVFGEIVPKTIGERYAEKIALLVAIPVTGLTFIFTPLVWLMEHITTPFTKNQHRLTTNEAEIKLLAKIGYQEGVIEDDELDMIERVFHLNDLTAAQLMTPRITITHLYGDETLIASQEQIINSEHSRILVIQESLDRVLGIVLKDELLAAIIQGQGSEIINKFTRKVHFVPETIRADRLLQEFQKWREHLVVALDEYGGVAGLVTLEDVLEVLTGEIVDETDRVIDLQEIARQRCNKLLLKNRELENN